MEVLCMFSKVRIPTCREEEFDRSIYSEWVLKEGSSKWKADVPNSLTLVAREDEHIQKGGGIGSLD